MPMADLFKLEFEQQGAVLTENLLAVERHGGSAERWSSMMRAAHSIKGAARLVNKPYVAAIAHSLEDCLTAMQIQNKGAAAEEVDLMLRAVDVMGRLAGSADEESWLSAQRDDYETVMGDLNAYSLAEHKSLSEESFGAMTSPLFDQAEAFKGRDDRTLRVGARQLDRLMALAGESLIQARWVRPYAEALRKLKREHATAHNMAQELKEALQAANADEKLFARVAEMMQQLVVCREMVDERVTAVEQFDVRLESLSSRLQSEVIASRMRPFRDIVAGLPRLVRDLARTLGKTVELTIEGQETLVDRDVLEKIEAPLTHLINNSLDHGIELGDERIAAGKPATGKIDLKAFHQGGMLYITIKDDGRGLDYEAIRARVVKRRLLKKAVAESLTQAELTEFLFMPGFSTRDKVSALSGRGVGLDVVRDALVELRGSVEATSRAGGGTQFALRLPLTLSVLPALLLVIADEPYAVALARVQRIIRLPVQDLISRDGRRAVQIGDEEVPLVSAARVLELGKRDERTRVVSVLVLGDRDGSVGFVVGRFLVESELSVHVLPRQLGKIADIGAAALMEDGTPALILDVDDMLRSGRRALARDAAQHRAGTAIEEDGKKKILVVDDSITVRELERKLLSAAGYEVDVAVDGMDGWNAVRTQIYDLVITDIDMPRLSGYQLVQMIKQDLTLREIPVLVVSAKEKRSERAMAMQSGAAAFLGKMHFHDESFLHVVAKVLARKP